MAVLLDFFPLVAFFVAYKLKGILVATGVIIVAVLIQVAGHWLMTRELKKMHLVTAVMAVVFGGLTLALEDPRFIQWKFSIIYWLFAAAFITSLWWGKKPLVQTLLETILEEGGGSKPDIDSKTWLTLNWIWATMFFTLGAVNVYVFKNFSEATWVNFKVIWATLAFFVFIIANIAWLMQKIPLEEDNS